MRLFVQSIRDYYPLWQVRHEIILFHDFIAFY